MVNTLVGRKIPLRCASKSPNLGRQTVAVRAIAFVFRCVAPGYRVGDEGTTGLGGRGSRKSPRARIGACTLLANGPAESSVRREPMSLPDGKGTSRARTAAVRRLGPRSFLASRPPVRGARRAASYSIHPNRFGDGNRPASRVCGHASRFLTACGRKRMRTSSASRCPAMNVCSLSSLVGDDPRAPSLGAWRHSCRHALRSAATVQLPSGGQPGSCVLKSRLKSSLRGDAIDSPNGPRPICASSPAPREISDS